MAHITAVIVTFNSAHCAEALGAQLRGWPHVTIVDNGSADGTPECMRAVLPQAQIIALPQNMGFGVANNRGFQAATTPYCLMINPDCAVQSDDAQALFETAQQWPDAAIVVPQLVGSDGRLQVNYGWVRDWWSSKGPAAEGVTCVGNACGAAMLLRMDQAPAEGWFDERFFLYYEDTDLSWRGRSRGWRYRTVPTARMRHVHAASSSDDSGLAQRLTERNRLLMLVRNASTRLAITQILRFPLTTASYARRDVVRPLLAGERPSGTRVGWRLRSFAGFLRLLPGALRDRRSLRALRILPVAEVESGLRVHE